MLPFSLSLLFLPSGIYIHPFLNILLFSCISPFSCHSQHYSSSFFFSFFSFSPLPITLVSSTVYDPGHVHFARYLSSLFRSPPPFVIAKSAMVSAWQHGRRLDTRAIYRSLFPGRFISPRRHFHDSRCFPARPLHYIACVDRLPFRISSHLKANANAVKGVGVPFIKRASNAGPRSCALR